MADAARRQPCPILRSADLVGIIAATIAVSQDVAWTIYLTIVKTLAVAVRARQSLHIEGFGTFRVRRLKTTGYLRVSFKPLGDWWANWMPVLAYDATTLDPIGIWDGPDLLPFGHPDNPYATAAEVPFAPDWSFLAATPLPGDPPPRPWPHPVRPTRVRRSVPHAARDADPANRRAAARAYYHRAIKTGAKKRQPAKM